MGISNLRCLRLGGKIHDKVDMGPVKRGRGTISKMREAREIRSAC